MAPAHHPGQGGGQREERVYGGDCRANQRRVWQRPPRHLHGHQRGPAGAPRAHVRARAGQGRRRCAGRGRGGQRRRRDLLEVHLGAHPGSHAARRRGHQARLPARGQGQRGQCQGRLRDHQRVGARHRGLGAHAGHVRLSRGGPPAHDVQQHHGDLQGARHRGGARRSPARAPLCHRVRRLLRQLPPPGHPLRRHDQRGRAYGHLAPRHQPR
mmetsp:Transcript_2419/g.6890  ORF Transcript_2419/g.6890 Transcript_2419/m.6890 type:complete len:212 (+) Transcript_2419:2298-2933(+)